LVWSGECETDVTEFINWYIKSLQDVIKFIKLKDQSLWWKLRSFGNKFKLKYFENT